MVSIIVFHIAIGSRNNNDLLTYLLTKAGLCKWVYTNSAATIWCHYNDFALTKIIRLFRHIMTNFQDFPAPKPFYGIFKASKIKEKIEHFQGLSETLGNHELHTINTINNMNSISTCFFCCCSSALPNPAATSCVASSRAMCFICSWVPAAAIGV